jgi:hypothetical protein
VFIQSVLVVLAGHSKYQQRNAIRLVHVCLSTLMKFGIPKAAVMESSLLLQASYAQLLNGKASADQESNASNVT